MVVGTVTLCTILLSKIEIDKIIDRNIFGNINLLFITLDLRTGLLLNTCKLCTYLSAT